ncbi:ATP-dependent DNA ligase [Skermania sp. ID1734]|uniref:non-homologous end-joining DNA ligase n=1 Tax=Skermania sp. ID1734 TaxID=2597516 RepID=UPI00117E1FD7|nr:non-homologous end-joining DNA ligase [Skermania sp. ID1734]TSD95364.1 ATP-dependent DNA ligase [Skermania sp. ID1734]
MTDAVTIASDGVEVAISNPDKEYFSARGETKLDLVRFYQSIEKPLLTALGGRPLLMERYPEGASGKSFFQKRVPKSAPDWLETTVVSTPNGTTSDALVAKDLAHILWAVNLGCIGFHVWPYHAATPESTDQLRIDLDPSPGVGYEQLRAGAWKTKALLDELGITAHIKTSGSRGLHIYAALQPGWDGFAVRAAAVALARELERRHPDEMTAQWWKEERGTRVFVDFNQNAPHKTVFGAWCVRPRVGAQVSTPIAWDELDSVDPAELTIATVGQRVAEHGDPWAQMSADPQSIEPLLEMSARDMANGMMDAPWPPVYPKMPNEPPRVAPSRAKKI